MQLFLLLSEADADRKSDVERKSSTEPDPPRRLQSVPIDVTMNSSYTSTICSSSTTTTAASATTTAASELDGMFDEFDWDTDSADSLQCLSEEALKKRQSVLIEKVSWLLHVFHSRW